ncbi:MAG: MoaD/ThiS family protein [Oscillospiraceae bacterium]|jgi:molybdopterin converting factor small subunit|nr:MoaD/ThiS family protein [Oscillospiraceae bacterium]
MAAVKVQYRGRLHDLGLPEEENLTVNTVKDTLTHIKTTFGAEAYKAAKIMLVAVNATGILMLKAWNTKLADGDLVQYLPICGGG